jgi:hypothetical protein
MKSTRMYLFERDPPSDSCWRLSAGPDGRIHAASRCELVPGGGVRVERYDERNDRLETVIDVADAVGEPLSSGRATHLSAPGYGQLAYSPWADWKDDARAFPRSYLITYDTHSDAVAWSAPFSPREGCRCIALDESRPGVAAQRYTLPRAI